MNLDKESKSDFILGAGGGGGREEGGSGPGFEGEG